MSNTSIVAFSFAILLAEHLILLMLWSGIVEVRQKKAVTWLALLVSLVLLSLLINLFIQQEGIAIIVIILVEFIVLRMFCSGRWYVLLFCAAIGIVFLKGIDGIVLYFVAILFQVTPQNSLENFYLFSFLALLSKTLEFVIAWVLKKIERKFAQAQAPHWQSWLQTLPLPLATCFLLAVSINVVKTSPQSAPLLLVLTLIFLFLCGLQILIARKLDKQKQTEADCMQLEQALLLRKENLQSLTEAYSAQRALTHDFNNHIETIVTLAQQRQMEELTEYLARLRGKSQGCTMVVHTNNVIVDAVLNQKYRIAAGHGIAVDFNLTDLSEIALPCEEIAVVLNNLLDNAIEACTKCNGRRLIWIKARVTDGELLLMITNTAEQAPTLQDGTLQTSKDNCVLHGFGLRNVNNILDAFRAEYTIAYKNGLFTFVALIPIPATQR